jgi:hypothetical protein
VPGPAGSEGKGAQGFAQPALSAVQVAADRQWLLLAQAAVALLSLAVFLTLFLFRACDDNRLTSWHWVFADADIFWITPVLAAGLVLAAILARAPFPGRRPEGVLFVCAFALAAVFWGEPEVIVDASRYFTQAKHIELYGLGYFLREWGGQIEAWTDLPLIPLLYGVIFSLAGEYRIYIQVLTTLLFSASVVLTYLIGKALWDEATGFCAGALLLGMPYLLTQVPLMLVDVPTMFFLILAIYATLKALERGGGGHLALASVALVLAFWTKYSAWLFLSVLAVVLLVRIKQGPRPVFLRALMLIMISMLLIGATLLPLSDVVGTQLDFLRRYQLPGLARWEESPGSTFLFQLHPFIAAAALVSVYAAFKNRNARYAIVLWLPALVTVLGINRIRYILPVFPMLALMAAYGLREVRCVELRKYMVLCIVTTSVAISVLGFRPFLQQTSAVNLKHAGEYLDTLDAAEVEVFALQQRHVAINPAVSVPLLDLHTAKRLVFRPDGLAPAGQDVETSALRFTWEYKNPSHYAAGAPRAEAVVVIADDDSQPLPYGVTQRLIGYHLARRFIASENVFGYGTIVKVYLIEHYPQRE